MHSEQIIFKEKEIDHGAGTGLYGTDPQYNEWAYGHMIGAFDANDLQIGFIEINKYNLQIGDSHVVTNMKGLRIEELLHAKADEYVKLQAKAK